MEEKFITEIEIFFFGQKLKHKAQMLEMENSMGQIKHTKEYITNRLNTAGETISGMGKRLRKYDTKIPVRERKSNISKL